VGGFRTASSQRGGQIDDVVEFESSMRGTCTAGQGARLVRSFLPFLPLQQQCASRNNAGPTRTCRATAAARGFTMKTCRPQPLLADRVSVS